MAQRNVRGYITYAKGLLEEKGHDTIELRAMGRAIHKAVLVGEPWVGSWPWRGQEALVIAG
jgi:DNA-binding protein